MRSGRKMGKIEDRSLGIYRLLMVNYHPRIRGWNECFPGLTCGTGHRRQRHIVPQFRSDVLVDSVGVSVYLLGSGPSGVASRSTTYASVQTCKRMMKKDGDGM